MKILLSLLIVALAGAETNSIGIHLKLIKPGHFVMGDNHDRTVAERTFGKDHGNEGTLPNGKAYANFAEFTALIVALGDRFERGLAEQLLTYALGRGLEPTDDPTVA